MKSTPTCGTMPPMLEYRIEDAFEIAADPYWDMFFSEDFSRGMFEAIDLEWELVELEREGSGADERLHRIQRLTPRREVPKFLAKFVEGAITYEEHNRWRRGDGRMSVETIPNFLAEKISSTGDYRVESRGPDACVRIFEGKISCGIPLIGKKVEKMLVEEVQQSYARAATFTRAWIAKSRG